MKIALVTRIYPSHRPGGMPFVCQDRAHALDRLGHEVRVLTTGRSPDMTYNPIDGGLVTYLDCPPHQWGSKSAEECVGVCNAWKPDIIHGDSLDVHHKWWVGAAKQAAVTLHGFAWGAFLTKWNLARIHGSLEPLNISTQKMLQEREAIASSDKVLTVSRHEQWMARDLFGLPAQLVYNPTAPYFFEGATPPLAGVKQYLCAAVSGHNERLFAVAQEAAQEAGVHLTVASDKTRREMPRLLDRITALIVPTAYSQGYDLTVAEALARRRPVICTATGSYLREAEVNQYLTTIPLSNPEAMKDSLAHAMKNSLRLPRVPEGAAAVHQPETHAYNWLSAILDQ